jgi:nucleotide-binding universal stress UspA family protein
MRIAYATDFSSAAAKAHPLAADLAARLSGTLHVVHVLESYESDTHRHLTPGVNPLDETRLSRVREERTEETKRIQERLTALAGEAGDWDLRWGEPVRELLQVANAADVMVMGAHGENRLDTYFLGGVAGRLVRRTPVPTLTVREEVSATAVGRVLVATDFSDAATHAWHALEAWRQAGIEMHVAHTLDAPRYRRNDDYKTQAKDALLALAGDASRTHLLDGPPAERLPEFARDHGFDAIAVGVRRRAGPLSVLLGSRADALIRSSDVPILSVPAPEA